MKKIILSFFVAAMALFMQSCEKNLLIDSTECTVTVNVDRGALGTAGLKVQSLVEAVPLANGSCSVKVFDNGIPQILAVTDDNNNVYMLYRGAVSDGATITINATSTALAMVTFNPLFGPVPSSEYASLVTKVTNTVGYSNLVTEAQNAINNGDNLIAVDNNNILFDRLGTVIENLVNEAAEGQTAIDQAAVAASAFTGTFPVIANIQDGELVLRTSANSPSYSAAIYMGNDTIDNFVVSASNKYSFMGFFNPTASAQYYGEPLYANFDYADAGTYTVSLNCTDASAMNDLINRLVTNTAATVGAKTNSMMVTILATALRQAVPADFDFSNVSDADINGFLNNGYSAITEALASDEMANLIELDGNWNIAGRLAMVYARNADKIVNLLRRVWNIADNTMLQYQNIQFQVNFDGNSTVTPVQ